MRPQFFAVVFYLAPCRLPPPFPFGGKASFNRDTEERKSKDRGEGVLDLKKTTEKNGGPPDTVQKMYSADQMQISAVI